MFETQLGLLFRAFGCWHASLGRPITSGGATYRVCVSCGARRLFDTDKWGCYGPYFYEKSPGGVVPGGPARRVAAHEAAGLKPGRAS